MFVLLETPSGYAFFKLLDESKLSQMENLHVYFNTPEDASTIVQLQKFIKFRDASEALAAMVASVEGKISKLLKKVFTKLKGKKLQIGVDDPRLGNAIEREFKLKCVSNANVKELLRCISSQDGLLSTYVSREEMTTMCLAVAHSLSTYKFKTRAADNSNTTIAQELSVLDDLEIRLTKYVKRCRELYGRHFPELVEIVTDYMQFVKVVKLMGTRDKAATTDLAGILPEDLEKAVKEAAESSIGSEISEDDILKINKLCAKIIKIDECITQKMDSLMLKVFVMAPNLTAVVGQHIAALLISHAGSLMKLSKCPAVTIQTLGANCTCFGALRRKKHTPKYGVIYRADAVRKCSPKKRGKTARSLAEKVALAARMDDVRSKNRTREVGSIECLTILHGLGIIKEGSNLIKIRGELETKSEVSEADGKPGGRKLEAGDGEGGPAPKKRVKLEESPKTEDKVEVGEKETPNKKESQSNVKEEVQEEDAVQPSQTNKD